MGTLRNLHPDPQFTRRLIEEKSFENDPKCQARKIKGEELEIGKRELGII